MTTTYTDAQIEERACFEGHPTTKAMLRSLLAERQAGSSGDVPGGRNMFYEGLFDGETERQRKVRLAWANDMRASFEKHTGNSWFDKNWQSETVLWSAAWNAGDGIAQAASYIQKKADDYAFENCSMEYDTGATLYNFGDAGMEYHHTLLELAEEIAAIQPPQPPTKESVRGVSDIECWRCGGKGSVERKNISDAAIFDFVEKEHANAIIELIEAGNAWCGLMPGLAGGPEFDRLQTALQQFANKGDGDE